ncbi:MAG: hypothetical protein JNJ47_08305, partial [Alphaproteobacteria bacterium]|nr:hypothetical protein [Alphaproteobacteria bacterium]
QDKDSRINARHLKTNHENTNLSGEINSQEVETNGKNLTQDKDSKINARHLKTNHENTNLSGQINTQQLQVQSQKLQLMNSTLESSQMILKSDSFRSQNAALKGDIISIENKNNFSSQETTYQGKIFNLETGRAEMYNNSFMSQFSSFKANTMRTSDNYHSGQLHSFDVDYFSGGVDKAVNMVDNLSGVNQVSLKMDTQDYENTGSKIFGHSNLNLSFRSVSNKGNIEAKGKLKLHGERSFTNTSSIIAQDDLLTTTKGVHRNDGSLVSEQGINYVEGNKIVSRAHEEAAYNYGLFFPWLGFRGPQKLIRPQYKGRNVVQIAQSGIDHEGVDITAKEDMFLKTEKGDVKLNPYTHYVNTTYDRLKKYESSKLNSGGN